MASPAAGVFDSIPATMRSLVVPILLIVAVGCSASTPPMTQEPPSDDQKQSPHDDGSMAILLPVMLVSSYLACWPQLKAQALKDVRSANETFFHNPCPALTSVPCVVVVYEPEFAGKVISAWKRRYYFWCPGLTLKLPLTTHRIEVDLDNWPDVPANYDMPPTLVPNAGSTS